MNLKCYSRWFDRFARMLDYPCHPTICILSGGSYWVYDVFESKGNLVLKGKGKSNGTVRPKSSPPVVTSKSAGGRTNKISWRLCPHLALESDPETSLLFPSPSGFCFRASPPASPKLLHQQNYCLSSRHRVCPILTGDGKKPLPEQFQEQENQRNANGGLLSRTSGRLLLVVILGLSLVLSAAWYFAPLMGWSAVSSSPSESPAVASTSTATVLPFPVGQDIDSDTSTDPSPTPPQSNPTATLPSPTVAAVATLPITPTATPSKPAVPTAIPTQPALPRARVLVTSLNVRGGPSLTFPIIGVVPLNEQVDVVARSADSTWWQICCVDDRLGWAFDGTIELLDSLEFVPVATEGDTTEP